MKHSLVVTGLLALGLLGGCPNNVQPDPAVKAKITASATSIEPGDTLVFDASQSTSKNGGALTYAWDFAGEGTATTATATHIFAAPGLYTVTLTVADETGATGVST
ncbi:MAG TPA: PKD domain-containing protein, partial [Phycisphaerae bacterium]|nr:PKD domain-containing protein [Phycisphaerae bacterium]